MNNLREQAFYEPGVRRHIEIPDMSLLEMFKQSVRKYPNQPALISKGQNWSYKEMDQAVEGLALALSLRGIKFGDRVSIDMPNSPQWVISFFALMRLGCIVVQTNPLYVENELRAQLSDAQATAIISIPQLLSRLQAIQQEVGLEYIIIDGLIASGMRGSDNILDLGQLIQEERGCEEAPWPQINAALDPAVLQYTGGTTGISKGVMLSHTNLVANALQIWEWIHGKEGKEKILIVLPLFHIYALSVGMNLAILSGSAMILLPKFDPEEVLNQIKNERPTLFPGAPTMYVALINHPRIKEYDLSSLRACISGSAPLPIEVAFKFGELTGGRLVEGYGLSEASPVTHINPLTRLKVGSIGVAVPNTNAKIVDLATGKQVLDPNEVGELVVSGPQVMLGYWQKNEETQAVLRNGWLHTGDLAKMDEQGYVYIVDRKKDMIISGGYNIYPREVEEILYKHPSIQEVACAGIPDSYWGEKIKAYIVIKEGWGISQEEIQSFLKGELAAFKIPKEIEFRDSLPRTAVGKVLRRFLIEEEKEKLRLLNSI
ncbi:long-chain-fatty-acid--CoA ligase [Desulfitobacterium metallireducens]|uniref:Long-chain fatty acid--CoA ligase n=1 Tax=Desulfitobacterium metallireducens DSM 15288 TaxID=871968 RepID=W0E9P5_9FIRM|nr:long-chain fatty acid--CoA ligase [Desulfitobacterium metallireducens]AHF07487.1 long-chain fatty acid--CoA ligase [Desulfitobacterium metallireducens DSM 15288]